MPGLDVVADTNTLSDKLDSHATDTHQIVTSLAQRQEDSEKFLQELKDLFMKSNIDAGVDAIEESIEALTADIEIPPRKNARREEDPQPDADIATGTWPLLPPQRRRQQRQRGSSHDGCCITDGNWSARVASAHRCPSAPGSGAAAATTEGRLPAGRR